jgi:hypothetical protein
MAKKTKAVKKASPRKKHLKLSVNELEIVDSNGKPRISFFTESDYTSIQMLDQSGNIRLEIVVDPAGDTSVRMFDSSSVQVTTLGAVAAQGNGLTINHNSGLPMISLGVREKLDKPTVECIYQEPNSAACYVDLVQNSKTRNKRKKS